MKWDHKRGYVLFLKNKTSIKNLLIKLFKNEGFSKLFYSSEKLLLLL